MISGNFYFSFVSTSLTYTTIYQKTKETQKVPEIKRNNYNIYIMILINKINSNYSPNGRWLVVEFYLATYTIPRKSSNLSIKKSVVNVGGKTGNIAFELVL